MISNILRPTSEEYVLLVSKPNVDVRCRLGDRIVGLESVSNGIDIGKIKVDLLSHIRYNVFKLVRSTHYIWRLR
jgi:hypothetical protein